MAISHQDVLRAYPSDKAEAHKIIAPYSYFFLGPLSLRLAPFFINRGVSANQVTALSLLVVLLAQLVAVLGAWLSFCFVLTGILVHLFYLLDNIDGHIARYCGTASQVGELFDALVTWVHLSLFPLSLGFALYLSLPGSKNTFGSDLPAWVWLGLAILRMYAYLFTIAVGRKTETIFMGKGTRFKPHGKKYLFIAKGVVELEPVLLIAAVPLRCVATVFFFYALFWLLILIDSIYRNLTRLANATIEESALAHHVHDE